MTQPPQDSAGRINALITLYCESHYDVELERGAVATMRIGLPAPPDVLRWIGADGIAFYLTSCNPHSQSLTHEENEQRLHALRNDLADRGIAYLEGAGHIPGEAWREDCLLVRGISEADVSELVRKHEQNSIVVVRDGAPTALRLYRSDWRAVIGERPDVEWA
jgi:hypothetical protein